MKPQFKEFTQFEDIPYRAGFVCLCGKSGNGYSYELGPGWGKPLPKAKLVGYCSTLSGYMMVFECPVCFRKFRYHGTTTDRYDFDRFKKEMELVKKLEK